MKKRFLCLLSIVCSGQTMERSKVSRDDDTEGNMKGDKGLGLVSEMGERRSMIRELAPAVKV